MQLPADTPLGMARTLLRQAVDGGERCPCCTQFAKVYKRAITTTAARALILFWRQVGLDYAHLPTVLSIGPTVEVRTSGGEFAKLAHWNLVEREPSGRAGWWRVTELGEQWIRRTVTVPEYARIYDSRCLNLVGEPVTIVDALGARFDFEELMAR